MKRFIDLLIMNFRKSVLPIIILVIVTVLVQVGLYNLMFSYDDRYENYRVHQGSTVAYALPVEFLDDNEVNRWNVVGFISLTAGIFLVSFCSREKEENYMVLRNLPVRRCLLWMAKFTQLTLCLVLVYLANYAALFLQYLIYTLKVKEEYRELFVFWWNNKTCSTFFSELIILIAIALLISVIYSNKHYKISKIRKGGK